MSKKALTDQRCIIPKGSSAGDRRYRYKAWWCMTAEERRKVSGRYPHQAAGIPDSAYAYPINTSGKLASARRVLLWSREHAGRRVGKHRAGLGRARRRR